MADMDKNLRAMLTAAIEILSKQHSITATLTATKGKRQWVLVAGNQKVRVPMSLSDHHAAQNWIKKTCAILTAPKTR